MGRMEEPEYREVFVNKDVNKDKCYLRKMRTFRWSVAKDRFRFREEHSIEECELCKSDENIQVDHYPDPFIKLLDDFININSIIYNDIKLFKSKKTKNGNHSWKLEFNGENIIPKWENYHAKNHSFRYLCQGCNLKCKTYGYTAKIRKTQKRIRNTRKTIDVNS